MRVYSRGAYRPSRVPPGRSLPALALLACLWAPSWGEAQQLAGTVVDGATGLGIAGASVSLADAPAAVTTTTADGAFSIPGEDLATASFIDVTAAGYVPARFLADPDRDDPLDLLLEIRTPAEYAVETEGLEEPRRLPAVRGALATEFLLPAVGATVVTTPSPLTVRYLDAAGDVDRGLDAAGIHGGFLVEAVPPGAPLSLLASAPNLDFSALAALELTAPAGAIVELGTFEATATQRLVPVLDSVTPATASALTSSVLVLEGDRFLPGAAVYAAGRSLEVLSRTATRLEALLPAGCRPATCDVRVENPGGPFFAQLRDGLIVTGTNEPGPDGLEITGFFGPGLLFVNPIAGVRSDDDAARLAAATGLTTGAQIDNLRLWLDFLHQSRVTQVRVGGVDAGGVVLFESPTLAAAGYPKGVDVTALIVPELERRGMRAVSPLELLGAIILDGGASTGLRPLTTGELQAVVGELAQQGVSGLDEERFEEHHVAAISEAAEAAGIEHIHFFFDARGSGSSYCSEEYLGYAVSPSTTTRLLRRIRRLSSAVVLENTVGLGDLSLAQARELGKPGYAGTSGSYGSPPHTQPVRALWRAATDRALRYRFFPDTAEDFTFMATRLFRGGDLLRHLGELLAAPAERRPIANLIFDVPAGEEAADLFTSLETSVVPAISSAFRAAGYDVRPSFRRVRPGGADAYYLFTFGEEADAGFQDIGAGIAATLLATDAPVLLHPIASVPAAGRSTSWDAVRAALGIAGPAATETVPAVAATAQTSDFGPVRWGGFDLASLGSPGEFRSSSLIDPGSGLSSPAEAVATGEIDGEPVALIVRGERRLHLVNGVPLHLEASTLIANVLAGRRLFRRPSLGYGFVGVQSAFLAVEDESFQVDVDLPEPEGAGSLRVMRFTSAGVMVDSKELSGRALPPTTLAPGELLVATRVPADSGFTVELAPGLNLISLARSPAATMRASDLLRLSGVRFVARVGSAGGRGRFLLHHPALPGSDFELEPSRGYLVGLDRSARTSFVLSGAGWDDGTLSLELHPGLAMIGLPRGAPAGLDSSDLAARLGAAFVSRVATAPAPPRFETDIPGFGPSFPVVPGEGYLIAVPAARAVTLPSGP